MRLLLFTLLFIPTVASAAPSMRAVMRIVNHMPLCAQYVNEINFVNMPYYSNMGSAGYDYINLNENLWFFELAETVGHECGHIVDYHTQGFNWLKDTTFGQQPYVSDYAQTDSYEDFAETYMRYVLYGEGNRKKRRVLDMILSQPPPYGHY